MFSFIQKIGRLEKQKKDPIEQTKSQVLVYLSMIGAITPIFLGLIEVIFKLYGLLIMDALLTVSLVIVFILAKKGKTKISANIFIFSLTTVLIVTMYLTDGLKTFILPTFIVSSMLGFYFLKKRNAVFVTVLIILVLISDIIFPQLRGLVINYKLDDLSYRLLIMTLYIGTLLGTVFFFVFIKNSQLKMYYNIQNDLKEKFNIVENIKGVSVTIESISNDIDEKINFTTVKLKKLNDISKGVFKLFNIQKESKEKTKNAINVMSNSIQNIETEISQQNTYINENRSTIEQFTSNIEYINKITGSMNDSYSNLLLLIQEGNEQMKEGQKSILKLLSIGKTLTQYSTGLNDIVENINVLAINANIEAANAGNTGAGFGVVANEVRNLAVESQNNITNMINNLDFFSVKIEEVSEKFQHIEKSFMKMESNNEKTKNLVLEVHNLMNKQNDSNRQLKEWMSILTKSAEKMNDSAHNINAEMNNIKYANQSLDNIISDINTEFKNQQKEIEILNNNLKEINDKFKRTKENIEWLYKEVSQANLS